MRHPDAKASVSLPPVETLAPTGRSGARSSSKAFESTTGRVAVISRPMSITQLRSFVEVYRQGSVSKAATILGLTQPAVSGHIASLESQIERKLFNRHARGMSPTLIADELALRVSSALDAAENALAEAKARSLVLSGTIHCCGPSDILSDLVVDRLQKLTDNGLSVQLVPSTDVQSAEMLLEGRVEFAFSVTMLDDPRIEHQVYGDEELVLIANSATAEKIRAAGSLAEGLLATPYLAYNIQRALITAWLEHNGIAIELGREAVTAPDLRALRTFVAKGMGWSVAPRYLVSASAGYDLVEIEGPVGNPLVHFQIHWLKSAMRNARTAKAKQLLTEAV